MGQIRVGVVGANPDRGWAARSHIPALRALPGYRLTAVGTSRPETAERAAAVFGAPHACTDPADLARRVDLVAVTVKVPAHAELVRAALSEGRDVYCEWPLARTTAEAEELAKEAREAGVRTIVGLQARYSPALIRARELLGTLGRLTSVTVHAARGKGNQDEVPAWTAYTYDSGAGAGLLEVYGGHVLDAVEYLAGQITELSARLSLQRPFHRTDTGDPIRVTAPDHLLIHGALAGGAVLSVHVHDGKAVGSRVRIELAGTEGDLTLSADAAGNPLGGQLQISALRGVPVEVPELPEEAVNVAGLYAAFAAGEDVPGFDAGVRLHRLLDAVRLSAETGRAVRPGASAATAAATAPAAPGTATPGRPG
ncbi:Gfo/Idh/MocA family oxidoreductase [Amycolatopsis cynarae]|uniref:Gfo/Idh/MocA family oxidoreductase n=1 Tax=Amycolatopsis cynarae TaxID=2995223 RepID=A0ABY7AX22_9PSEU|nr:Gfo/Idh/MocA family oxidoreductase [Amycolatopsis sp. HUAS 11-8]WAL63729.1 Gfo/Idh/MocA family oxidoreductase [Amycolatopsis sp. HUAS 11-8]